MHPEIVESRLDRNIDAQVLYKQAVPLVKDEVKDEVVVVPKVYPALPQSATLPTKGQVSALKE